MQPRKLAKCRRTLKARSPIIGAWLRYNAARALAEGGSPEALAALADESIVATDPEVCLAAWKALCDVSDQPSVEAVCAAWARIRDTRLAELIAERGWTPAAPPEVVVLNAFKTSRWQSMEDVAWLEQMLKGSDLAYDQRDWLESMLALVRWRRRHDIQIAEEPSRTSVGEFDIEVDG